MDNRPSAFRSPPAFLRRSLWRRLCAAVWVVGLLLPIPTLADEGTLADYPVVGGHFFTQAGGGGDRGYAITDLDGVPFFTTFDDMGGVEALGYPASRRFEFGGFVS